jgi:hypothetical protein
MMLGCLKIEVVSLVIAGLDPAIHLVRKKDGCAGHKGVHALLRRPMPGHDEKEAWLFEN